MGGKWVFLYDADCGMCTRLKDWALRRDRAGILRAVSLWEAEADRVIPEVPRVERERFAFLRAPDGRLFRGHEAIIELLALLPGGAPLRLVRVLPGYRPAAGIVYGWVSARRLRGVCGIGRERGR